MSLDWLIKNYDNFADIYYNKLYSSDITKTCNVCNECLLNLEYNLHSEKCFESSDFTVGNSAQITKDNFRFIFKRISLYNKIFNRL